MVHDQKLTTFIACIVHAFETFGGVPKKLKIDNLRAAVIKNQHYDLQFQPDFLDFAFHYNTVITPCTPYHPEQKGGVESDVKYIEGNFLSERHFTDWPDLVNQFHTWSTGYANQRIHGVTKKIPQEVFNTEEKAALQALPILAFTTFDRCERKVASNCHVFFNTNYYSVPAKWVGKTVTLRFTEKLLKVSFQGEEGACHLINSGKGNYVTCRSHLPDYKCYSTTEHEQQYEAKMADIGEYAQEYFKDLLLKQDRYWFKSVRLILGLAQEYGNEAVNLSLKRALNFHVTNMATIKKIVEERLYELDSPPKLTDPNRLITSSVATITTSWDRDLNYYAGLQGQLS